MIKKSSITHKVPATISAFMNGVLAFMQFYMFFHITWITKRLVAYLAAKWLESCMRTHVDLKHIFSAVHLSTIVALETLVTGRTLGSMMGLIWEDARMSRVVVNRIHNERGLMVANGIVV